MMPGGFGGNKGTGWVPMFEPRDGLCTARGKGTCPGGGGLPWRNGGGGGGGAPGGRLVPTSRASEGSEGELKEVGGVGEEEEDVIFSFGMENAFSRCLSSSLEREMETMSELSSVTSLATGVAVFSGLSPSAGT